MSLYTKKVTPTASYPALTAPDVDILFEPMETTFNLLTSGAAESAIVSCDGTDNANSTFELTPMSPNVTIRQYALKRFWIKSAGTTTVQVIAQK